MADEKVISYKPTKEDNANYKKQCRINCINNEISLLKNEFEKLDYIGIKIATGRGTIEEYKDDIKKMDELALKKESLLKELYEIEGTL